MSRFFRKELLSRERYVREKELINLLNAGIQTNTSLKVFTGTNSVTEKLKNIPNLVQEESSIFEIKMLLYRLKNRKLDELEAKINNAISHSVYLLRENGVLLDVVEPTSLNEYRAYGFVPVRDDENNIKSKVSNIVFSYYDTIPGNIDYYIERLYNIGNILRVIVFDDLISYESFIKNVREEGCTENIENQIHVVCEHKQDVLKSSNFYMNAFIFHKNERINLDSNLLSKLVKSKSYNVKNSVIATIQDDYLAEI